LVWSLIASTNGATQFANEFWISTNTATADLGTLSDPYDGSTAAKFDARMSAMPANTAIHIIAGTYQTGGNAGWAAKSGQNISGSGKDITILHLTNGSPTSSYVVTCANPATNVAVSDLTLDLGGSTNVNGAIDLTGYRHSIRRVKATNAVLTRGSSYYQILIDSTGNGGPSDKNLVEECEVSVSPGQTPCCAISMLGSRSSPITGIITRNKVYLADNANSGNTSFLAYMVSNMCNSLIEGNYVLGANDGLLCYSGTNLIISHNQFRDVDYGLELTASNNVNISFCYNTIELSSDTNYSSVGVHCDPSGVATNLSVIGNTIKFNTTAGTTPYAFSGGTIAGLTFVNNSADSSMLNYVTGSTGLNIYNNTDLQGNFLTSLNQIEPPNGIVRKAISANYTATYADRYIGVTGALTVTLPNAVGYAGKEYIVAYENGSGGNLTITATSPNTINGSSSVVFSLSGYSGKSIISDGANWFSR